MVDETRRNTFEDAKKELNDSLATLKQLRDDDKLRADRAYSYTLACRLFYDISFSVGHAQRAGVPHEELRGCTGAIREILLRSAFIRRLQEWPRGYQGDYETIEKLYFAVPESPDDFGRLLDSAAFNLPICQQHRNKIAQQCEEIRRVCNDKSAPRILVVASGGAIDAWQARADLERASATVVFNDIEDDALRLIQERFGASHVAQHYVAGNMFRKRRELTRLGKFDLILCGGLFDYVDMRHIQPFVRTLFDDALTDQGCMLFTNLAGHNPYRYFIETVCAWEMQYRSEDDMVQAVHDAIPHADVHHWRDQTKLAVFYRLAKRAIS